MKMKKQNRVETKKKKNPKPHHKNMRNRWKLKQQNKTERRKGKYSGNTQNHSFMNFWNIRYATVRLKSNSMNQPTKFADSNLSLHN